MNRFALTVLIFAMVTGAPALAQTAPAPAPTTSPTASPLQRIGTVKVTGASSSREEQFQAPFSGSVIDRQQLQELGPKSMQGILSSSPSVQAFGFGGSPYVRTHLSFRGFTGGEFGETLDDIPLNGLFNGGVTNSASQRNATPFVTDLIGSVNIYRGVNDPQHTSIDSLGGSVAYHLIDPTSTSSTSVTYNAGHGADAFIQTGVTPLGGAKFAIAFGSDYYRGFQNDVPDANRYVYLNGTVPLTSRDFVRLIYSYDHNVGYVPHDVPLQPLSGVAGFSIAESGISFQWPATLTYSHNTADVSLLLADYAHQWSPALVSRLTLFRYDTQYQRMSYTNANYPFLPNSPFAPTFAQGYMNGTISSNAQDFAYHLYQNGDQRLGFVFRTEWDMSAHNSIVVGTQYEHGYERSAEYWGPTLDFAPIDTVNDAWNQPGYRNSKTAYIEDKLQVGKLLLNPGLRYNRVETADYTPVVGYFYSTPFAVGNVYNFLEPSVGARYAFNPKLTAYAGFGTSAKPPEIAAYYNDNQVDPITGVQAPLVVQPEYSIDLDAGVRGKLPGGALWTIDGYNDRFINTFSSAPASVGYYESLGESPSDAQNSAANNSITVVSNAGDAVYRGYEFAVDDVPLAAFGSARLTSFLNFSQNTAVYTSAFLSSSGSNVTIGTNVPFVPHHLWNVGLRYHSKRVDAQIAARIVGDQQIFDNTTAAPSPLSLAPYTTVDAYVGVDLGSTKNLVLSASGSNLFGAGGLVYSYISSSYQDANGNTVPVQVGMPLAPTTVDVSLTAHFR